VLLLTHLPCRMLLAVSDALPDTCWKGTPKCLNRHTATQQRAISGNIRHGGAQLANTYHGLLVDSISWCSLSHLTYATDGLAAGLCRAQQLQLQRQMLTARAQPSRRSTTRAAAVPMQDFTRKPGNVQTKVSHRWCWTWSRHLAITTAAAAAAAAHLVLFPPQQYPAGT
jgi:hypothetical protein